MTISFSKYIIPTVILLVSILYCHSIDNPPDCMCEEKSQCQRVPDGIHLKHEGKEVYVMSDNYNEPRKTWKDWNWTLISNVISVQEPDSTLMCYTHSKGRRYGYTAELHEKYLQDENGIKSWINGEKDTVAKFFIDIYLLDMVRLTASELTTENVTVITDVILELKTNLVSVSPDISFLCLINWFPPCREYQCKFITEMLRLCDKFMLNAESFLNVKESHCLAQATIPITKLRLGFDEYMANGVSPKKFILSIPWHGYVYECDVFNPKGNGSLYDQCFIRKQNGSQICDYKHYRHRIDVNTMIDKYKEYERDDIWNSVYLSPYFNIKETTGKMKQIWFEDYRSLNHKYVYIRDMNVSGLALWSGNDLQHSSASWYEGYNKVMWGWLAHQALMHPKKDNSLEDLKKLPQLMAGIGFGCVLIGGILGFIFGWGVFRRTHKRNRRQPFDKDMVYMEEDQNL